MQHFWDKDEGGLFFSADDAKALLLRRKEYYDGALPSGNSIAMLNLLRLMHLSGQAEWEERAWDLARAFFCHSRWPAPGPLHAALLPGLCSRTGI